MRGYNLYYKNQKVNSNPLSSSEISDIKSQKYVIKKNRFTGQSTKIPIEDCKVVEVVIL
jgi:hypothetical protein